MSNLIIKAARFAELNHRGQLRKFSGQKYIVHPARVAHKVMCLPESSEIMVAAAYCHELLEDQSERVKYTDLVNELGVSVADLVYWLTNPSKESKASRAERKQIDRDWLKKSPNEVKVIKMCDRLDNLYDWPKTDGFFPKYLIESKALFNECLLGVNKELEDEFNLFCELN